MKCPYCAEEMRRGVLRAGHQDVVYWLPDNVDPYVGPERRIRILVEKYEGVLLDKPSRIGFSAVASPFSYFCGKCGVFITKMAEDE